MANVTLQITDNITSQIKKVQKQLEQLPQEVYKEFVKITPIRSGNARRKTKLQGNNIVANYPYAEKLDKGSSQQAPDGMTKPIEKFMQKRIKQILRGK